MHALQTHKILHLNIRTVNTRRIIARVKKRKSWVYDVHCRLGFKTFRLQTYVPAFASFASSTSMKQTRRRTPMVRKCSSPFTCGSSHIMSSLKDITKFCFSRDSMLALQTTKNLNLIMRIVSTCRSIARVKNKKELNLWCRRSSRFQNLPAANICTCVCTFFVF